MIALAHDFLRGSYVPLVTPFRAGEVDYAAFAALVANQVDHGSHGIVVAGTTGEANALTSPGLSHSRRRHSVPEPMHC